MNDNLKIAITIILAFGTSYFIVTGACYSKPERIIVGFVFATLMIVEFILLLQGVVK